MFLHALKQEWDRQRPILQNRIIDTIYFGGGTPSLCPEAIILFLDWAKKEWSISSNVEITAEANPEDITKELISLLAEAGVNRLSLGVQSLEEQALHTLERSHTPKSAQEALWIAYEKIQNLSIDILYDIPHDKDHLSLEKTLMAIQQLPIQHISIYNLTIEPHTSFYKRKISLPPPKKSKQSLQMILDYLKKAGFVRYEISAFCKEGFCSRHNSKYWTGEEFLGFGPSAWSFLEGARFRNQPHILRYAKNLQEGLSPIEFSEKLEKTALFKEIFCLQLRMIQGIHKQTFSKKFGDYLSGMRMDLDQLIQDQLILETKTHIQLSHNGLLFHDTIAEKLI